jgi:hypothetical protein
LSETLPKQRNTPPNIDPRLEPFLQALAELIARQALHEMEEKNRKERDLGEGRTRRPQVD